MKDFDTSEITDMSYLFYNCQAIKSLDLSTFNTQNVMDMRYLFYNCKNLESIASLDTFKTNNVQNMAWMFYHCDKLTSFDISNFDTSSLIFMEGMFCGIFILLFWDKKN